MPATKPHPHTGDFAEWCDDTRPHLLTLKEWAELIALPEIKEAWGLDESETAEQFSKRTYSAKFHFHSGSPGYVGDLFIIQGDALTGDAPWAFLRDNEGRLKRAH